VSSLLTLRPALGGTAWELDAVPHAYDEAGRAQFKAMPGVRWVVDRSSPNGRGFYRGPREAIEITAATLEAAAVIKVRNEAGSSLPPVSGLISTRDYPGAVPAGLRSYQIDGVAWLRSMLRHTGGALLADDMGIGKSAQAIVALDSLAGEAVCVVVCPASVRTSWERQIKRWGRNTLQWAVFGYEQFERAHRKGELPPASALVIDEIHYCANARAKRTQAVAAYRQGIPYAIGLTGTPMLSDPRDLHSPLDLLHPGRWGRAWDFQKRYCDGRWEEIRIGDEPKQIWKASGVSRPEELAARLAHVMLRRTKADVALELPPIVRSVIDVEIPRKARNDLKRAAKAIDWTGQARTGVGSLLREAEGYKLEAAEALARELEAAGQRPLLLTTRKRSARALAVSLGAPVVTGDDHPDGRLATLAAGRGAGVATIYALGTGVDGLQELFDSVIFVGLDWLPTVILQAEARLHRLGQLRGVSAFYLVGLGTIDEVVRERVIDRLDAFETIVGAGEGGGLRATLGGGGEDELIAAMVAAVKAA
jgi:SWI/SNF-related matrix-associated actin-dependent regulator 1 of chromatin subfamily A